MNPKEQKNSNTYWIDKLENATDCHVMEKDLHRVSSIVLQKKDIGYFSKLTSGNELTEHTVFLAIYATLLRIYFDEDIFIGSKSLKADSHGTIGKPLIFSISPEKNTTLKEVLKKCRDEVQKGYKYINYSRDYVNNTLGNAIENYAPFALFHGENTESFAECQLKMNVQKDMNEGFLVTLSFSELRMDEFMINGFLRNVKNWIEGLEDYLNSPVLEIPLLSDEEKKKLIGEFNAPVSNGSEMETLVGLFAQQVEKTPEEIALVYENTIWTYTELDEMSNQLAHYLKDVYNVKRNDLIAIKLKRNEWLPVAILAALKSGGAYVPIDVNYPLDRQAYIQENSDPKAIIDTETMNAFKIQKQHYSDQSLDIVNTSEDLAYVIYTSGTTGNPKGVMITNSNAVSMIDWAKQEFDCSKFNVVYAATSHCFDLSVFEMFFTLSVGKKMRLLDNALDIEHHIKKDTGILLNTVPSVLRKLIEEGMDILDQVVMLNLAGEVFPVDLAKALPLHKIEVRNLYGPSEDTTYSTFYQLKKDKPYGVIPIGRPIPNTQAYILDEQLKLAPLGAIGKLYLSGKGISKGYLKNTELTNQKFIEHSLVPIGRLYDTGDLAKWDHNGNIIFLGRKDHQVKLHGHRIELGEIENSISRFSKDMIQAVVMMEELKNGKTLIAYYVSKTKVEKPNLKDFLKEKLPMFMIPSFYVQIEEVPLTPNGKIDRKKLKEISKGSNITREIVAPTNKIEEKVIEIWKELLEQDQIGITDDFYELGGHSLLLSKLTNEYHRIFKAELNLKQVYSNTKLSHHTDILSKVTTLEGTEITKLNMKELYDVSPSQLRFWLLYKIHGKTKEFNICNMLPLPDSLNIEAFEHAFNVILERHEILRTVFVEENGVPKQKVLEFEKVKIPYYEANTLQEVQNIVFNYEFDLDVFPLYKIGLINNKNRFSLYFNMHHSISDGWSMGIIAKELMEIYDARVADKRVVLPILDVDYKDYAHWQNEKLNNGSTNAQKEYWKQKLSGPLPYIQLPIDNNESLSKNKNLISGYYTLFFDESIKQKIDSISKENKVSVFSIFVASMKILLNRLTSIEDIIVGIPAANRNHYQLKNMVGCFLNTLMLRNTLDSDMSFETFLENVHGTIIDALANQNFPFENVLEELNIPKDHNSFPLSSVFLNIWDFDSKPTEYIENFDPQKGIVDAKPKFDFECYFKSYLNGYEIKCVYDHGLFKPKTIKYWMEEYMDILGQVVKNIKRPIKTLKSFEKSVWETKDPVPGNLFRFFEEKEIHGSIVGRFEKTVSRNPYQVALNCGEHSILYDELNNRANYFGNKVLDMTNGKKKRVALLLEHNERSVIGMLSVLKAGCSYVPIDFNNPLDRIQFIIKDAGCDIVVCDASTLERARELKSYFPEVKILTISTDKKIPKTCNLSRNIDQLDEAYVLYTSGSTGMPKGVVQNHRNVLHFIRVYTNNIHISDQDRLSVFSTYTFDASVKDIYGALLNGATLEMYDIVKNGLDNLSEWFRLRGISIIHMVPTVYRYFLRELNGKEVLPTVRIVDLGGEACYKSDFEMFKMHFKRGALLVNDYGPTESTIVSQKFLSHDSEVTRSNISLGKPVQGTEVYLLDEKNNKKGVYEEGEITFRSDYLSLGYLNKDELTKKVFLTDQEGFEGRIYKSGDIGRLLPNGEIEFLRRKDGQVKLNGQRIEISDIEQNLLRIPEIEQGIVLLKEINGQGTLVAYIKLYEGIEIAKNKIVSLLSDYLPAHMIPPTYIFMEVFPRTRTGKIDRKKLPIPLQEEKGTAFVAPRNELEKQLVTILSNCLDVDEKKIGVNDNFYDLGGNSLKMIKVLTVLNEELKLELKLLTLFKYPSIRALIDGIYGDKEIQVELIEDNVSESIDEMIDLIGE